MFVGQVSIIQLASALQNGSSFLDTFTGHVFILWCRFHEELEDQNFKHEEDSVVIALEHW